MINLLKYELKSRKIPTLWVVAGIFIVNLLIAIRFMFLAPSLERLANELVKNPLTTDPLNYISNLDPFLLVVALISSPVIFVFPLFNGISSFRTDYFRNPKYLVASIPKSANQIIGAKLLITLFEAILVSVSFFLWFTSYAYMLMRGASRQYLYMFFNFLSKNIVPSLLGYTAFLFQLLLLILIIYFILVVFKFIRIHKAIKIVIAVIAFNLIGFIESFFTDFFGQMSILDVKVKTYELVSFHFSSTPDAFIVNIGVVVFYISFAIALFYATTYLIDNKMEV